MKIFEAPVIEVMNFDVEDVVTTSDSTTETTLPALIPPCVN